ncbi:MAG: N-acetylmuramoyl-L-alanine amidase [Gammaproteobacteria bacterium]|nr:N-acetylmuramoyl-L-alanine amidase [Gammaproteobacteria bacterium]
MVQGVRLWTSPDSTRVVLTLSGPAEHQLLTLSGPDRVVIDLRDARMQSGVSAHGNQGVIRGLRTGIRNGHDLRVVLDLAGKVKPRSFYLKPDGVNGHRIVVDLLGSMTAAAPTARVKPVVAATPARTTTAAAPLVARAQIPASSPATFSVTSKATSNVTPKIATAKTSVQKRVQPKPVEAVVVQAAPAPKPRVAESVVDTAPVETMARAPAAPAAPVKTARDAGRGRELIVAIDAGHGGKDVGARGPSGTHEKDVVLAIARKLATLVDSEPGMRPVLVRDGDYFIRLRDRMKKARTQRADLFVSIHADAFSDHRAQGSSVFVVSERGATSEMARILADQENAADLVGGVSLNDKDDLLKSVLLDLSQSASIEASMSVADNVLGELKHIGNVHKSRVQQAGFMVLKSPDVPSILVETAFISNPTEERQLRDTRHQQRLAQAIMKGIRAYFRENPPPGTVMANRDSNGESETLVASRDAGTESVAGQAHVIKSGETLSELAERYAVSMQRLRLANNLTGDRLRVGSVLRIPATDS